MIFYKENKLNQKYELTDSQFLKQFKEWCKKQFPGMTYYRGIHKSVMMFIGSKDGLNSVSESDEEAQFKQRHWTELKEIVYGKEIK